MSLTGKRTQKVSLIASSRSHSLFHFCFFLSSSFLTPDRLEKLNSIGFVWSVRGETIDELDADQMIKESEAVKEEAKQPSVDI